MDDPASVVRLDSINNTDSCRARPLPNLSLGVDMQTRDHLKGAGGLQSPLSRADTATLNNCPPLFWAGTQARADARTGDREAVAAQRTEAGGSGSGSFGRWQRGSLNTPNPLMALSGTPGGEAGDAKMTSFGSWCLFRKRSSKNSVGRESSNPR